MKKIDLINTVIAALLILGIGLTVGYSLGSFEAKRNSFPTIKTVPDINPGISTIQFLEVKNGELIGRITGRKARIAYDTDEIFDLGQDSYFKVPLNAVNLANYYQAERIPEDISYIASSNGKYYYSILDKKALSITPDNRLYFSSSKEAQEEGYLEAN